MNKHCAGVRLYHFGECAIVLELEQTNKNGGLPAQQSIWQLDRALRHHWQADPAIRDIVPGDANITVVFEPLLASAEQVCSELKQQWRQLANQANESSNAAPAEHGKVQQLQVIYGGDCGPDLAKLAERCGITPTQLIELHCSVEYRVAFLGFQPGFAYLQGLDTRLHAARRAQPRLQVPANSLAIGGSYCGIYPAPSPGGWHIIGRYTEAQGRMFDCAREQPGLLEPGARVRFMPLAATTND